MARLAGRQGRVYLALASGGTATPVAFQASWSLNFSTNKIDVTAYGDATKVYVAGLPDAQGQFAGFYDDATVQTYTAATDGVARAFYLYPTTNNNAQYFWGTVFPDMSIDSTVDGAIAVSASFAPATPILKVG
jgi:hypothetical protein